MGIYQVAFALAVGLILSGCSSPRLYGRLEKLDKQALVSSAFHTPDPQSDNPPDGQRLIVSWVIPLTVNIHSEPCVLEIDVVDARGIRTHVEKSVTDHWGHFEYEVPLKLMQEGKSIITYFLQLRQGSRTIGNFQHRLYKTAISPKDIESDEFETIDF